MPRLNQKKVITLRAKIMREYTETAEVNPSIRLTDVQRLVDDLARTLIAGNPGYTVEVTAEGLV